MADRTDREGERGTPVDAANASAAEWNAEWTREEQYWRDNYRSRPYASADRGFDHYAGAYRYGLESARRHAGRTWDQVEGDVREGWDSFAHRGGRAWLDVKGAVRDAWARGSGKPAR